MPLSRMAMPMPLPVTPGWFWMPACASAAPVASRVTAIEAPTRRSGET
jgi:hypothetical protein